MKNATTICIYLFCLLMAGELQAWTFYIDTDSRLRFKYINEENGLTQNSATSILQDKNGLLLFSTYEGLNFYDGYDIQSVRYSSDNPEGLFNNRITRMKACANGDIWLALDGGLAYYDIEYKRYINYTDSLGQLSSYKILSIELDRKENVWLGTEDELIVGIKKSDGSYDFSGMKGLITNSTHALLCDHEGNMWVGTSNGAFLFSQKDNMRKVHMISQFQGRMVTVFFCDAEGAIYAGLSDGLEVCLPGEDKFNKIGFSSLVSSIVQDIQGNLWVGTPMEGLFRLTLTDYKLENIVQYTSSDLYGGIADDNIFSLYIDPSNVLWVGMRKGVNYADISPRQIHLFKPLIHHPVNKFGYTGLHVNTLFRDSKDQLWISTYQEGLLRYDFQKEELTNMSSDITSLYIFQIIEAKNGTLWVSSRKGIYQVTNPAPGVYKSKTINIKSSEEKKYFRYFLGIGEDAFEYIWIATIQGLIRYDPKTETYITYRTTEGLPFNALYCLLSDTVNRTIWVGSSNKGLAKISYDEKGLCDVETLQKENTPNSISHDQVWCIHKSKDGTIWAGTDAGLNRIEMDGKEIKSSSHIRIPLLKDAKVSAITEDTLGNLWLNGIQGLLCYNPKENTVRQYLSDDGMQSNTFTNASVALPGGWVFVGGINGVNFFNPLLFEKNSYKGRPYFTRLKVFNESIEPNKEYKGSVILSKDINDTKSIELNYKQNNFMIEFSSDHYVTSKRNRFHYQLIGRDADWIEVDSKQRYAFYENLPAGHYSFFLQFSNKDGDWSDVTKVIEIDILPPPWASWWAYTIYAIILLITLMLIISYFISRQRWKHELLVRELEQQMQRELSEMKLNFFTNITHELRTPLTLIMAPLRDLNNKFTDEYAGLRLKIINKNANKLLELINHFLDIRHLSAKTLPLVVAQHDIHLVVKNTIDSLNSMSQQTGVGICYVAFEQPLKGWFDQEKIEKVLYNIISNALKFTPEGGNIEIKLWTERLEERHFAFISVKDTGIGIAEHELSNIFDFFYHKTPITGYSSGIGLTMAKALVELHGGEITVESEINVGSTFTFSFRIDKGAYQPEYIAKTNVSEQITIDEPPVTGSYSETGDFESKGRYTILIIEDNEDMRAYISDCLKDHFRIITALDGEDGLNIVQKKLPDIIITDMMMPRMDGLEFIRKMKMSPRTSYIPIIVHSIKNDKKTIREAFEAGAQEYIVKPFDSEVLILRITNQLSSRAYFAEKIKFEKSIEPEEIEISPQEDLLNRIRTVVEKNMSNVLFGVDQLISEIGMSRTQLFRKLKELPGGKPASEVIRQIRIQRAAQLLSTGQLRVSEVMDEVGISNHHRFVKYFQEVYGISPKDYIRKFNKTMVYTDEENEETASLN